eukprot:SAG31_NODE_35_length_31836_cov_10.841352_30_plen_93_part_00
MLILIGYCATDLLTGSTVHLAGLNTFVLDTFILGLQEAEFEQYANSMPWPAVPWRGPRDALAANFQVCCYSRLHLEFNDHVQYTSKALAAIG